MDSLWKSFAQSGTVSIANPDGLNQTEWPNPIASSFQTLLTKLACSHLNNLAIENRLYPDLGMQLGTGATFSVERKQAQGQVLVAIKHIIQDKSSGSASRPPISKHRLDSVLLEVQALLHYPLQKHPNIVDLLAYGWDDGCMPFLVVEYADLGSLDSFLKHYSVSWETKLKLALDVASGLELLHACEIVHGDVKLENILVFSSADGPLGKVSDFGFCCSEVLVNNTYHGTRVLNAPELRHDFQTSNVGSNLDYMACDTYSYGILTWEILNEGSRFYSVSSIGIPSADSDQALQFLEQVWNSGNELYNFTAAFVQELLWPFEVQALIEPVFRMTLSRDPEHRSSMEDVRLQLDPDDKKPIELGSPLRLPHYSIFNIMTAPLIWDVRAQLANQFQAGATEMSESGQHAFNIAACHALGFGVRMSAEEAFRYLELSANQNYAPARVLWTAFNYNGLCHHNGKMAAHTDAFSQYLETLEKELLQIPPSLRFTARIRSFYKKHFAQMSSFPMTISELGITSQSLDAIEDIFLAHISFLHQLTVTLDVNGNQIRIPLMHHLISSHQDFAEMLLRKGVNAEILTEDDVSLLNVACAAGAFRIVQLLIDLFPSLTRQNSKDGISPLHWLFMFSESEIPLVARLLIHNNSSLLANGVMELHDFSLILSGLPLHWAVMTRSTYAVRALLDLGANPNQQSFALLDHWQYPEYAVDIAVSLHMPEMVQLLVDHGADVFLRAEVSVPPAIQYIGDAIDPFFIWLLHGNCYKDAARETLQVLLKAGLHINMCSDDNIAALQHASTRANYQTYVLETILELGPSVATSNDPSRSSIYLTSVAMQHDRLNFEKMKIVLDYSQKHLIPEEFRDACRETLRKCARDGTVGAASVIIPALGAESKAIINEGQFMHLAAEHDETEMIRLFLGAGADINFSIDGTPAATAAGRGKMKALEFLLSNGSTVRSMRNDVNEDTLLHEIVGPLISPSHSSATLSFVQKNFRDLFVAVVDNYNMFGFTALHEAIIWGNLKNVAILLEHFKARPRNVEDTDISPTTLVTILQSNPPGYYIQQGELALQGYQETLNAILNYLCETCELHPPILDANGTGMSDYWKRWPDNRLLAQGDDTAWWQVIVG